jgi:hypothetical protein
LWSVAVVGAAKLILVEEGGVKAQTQASPKVMEELWNLVFLPESRTSKALTFKTLRGGRRSHSSTTLTTRKFF